MVRHRSLIHTSHTIPHPRISHPTLQNRQPGANVSNRSACNYITDTWTTNEHLSGCNEPTCPGCRPCQHDHCEHRGCSWHVDHDNGIWTCPRCIGRTRRDLTTIRNLHAANIPTEAEQSGDVRSEVVMLNGPAAIVCDYDAITELRNHQRRRTGDEPKREQTTTHTFTIVGGWDLALREIYGPETKLRVTIPRAIDYLINLLNGQFPHSDQFPGFANEIAECRSHLEAVLHDSRAPETGAKCPRCPKDDAQRLVRRYGDSTGKHFDNCTDDDCQGCSDILDTWHCPNDGAHWWKNEDYRAEIEVASRETVKGGTWLTANEVSEHHGVKVGTLRKWATRNRVKSRWMAEQLRYDTRDIKAILESRNESA